VLAHIEPGADIVMPNANGEPVELVDTLDGAFPTGPWRRAPRRHTSARLGSPAQPCRCPLRRGGSRSTRPSSRFLVHHGRGSVRPSG
jgi:hypothetical protein